MDNVVGVMTWTYGVCCGKRRDTLDGFFPNSAVLNNLQVFITARFLNSSEHGGPPFQDTPIMDYILNMSIKIAIICGTIYLRF
jgi:hypothetical protein